MQEPSSTNRTFACGTRSRISPGSAGVDASWRNTRWHVFAQLEGLLLGVLSNRIQHNTERTGGVWISLQTLLLFILFTEHSKVTLMPTSVSVVMALPPSSYSGSLLVTVSLKELTTFCSVVLEPQRCWRRWGVLLLLLFSVGHVGLLVNFALMSSPVVDWAQSAN